jgi:PilZ domain
VLREKKSIATTARVEPKKPSTSQTGPFSTSGPTNTQKRGGTDGRGKQRAVRRCPFVASCEVTDVGSGARLSARTSELGVGGCYIDALNPFPVGTIVQLRILRDQGVFESKAKVVYVHPKFGMGVAFSEIATKQRSLLEDWLAELVAQLRPIS